MPTVIQCTEAVLRIPTFLNAFTSPDKTMYPVASCNDKDFANLMDVYLDATLYPNIYKYEEILQIRIKKKVSKPSNGELI